MKPFPVLRLNPVLFVLSNMDNAKINALIHPTIFKPRHRYPHTAIIEIVRAFFRFFWSLSLSSFDRRLAATPTNLSVLRAISSETRPEIYIFNRVDRAILHN